MHIVAFAGGIGASKLLFGLARVMDPAQLTIIVNTGDDIELLGLYISPDLDIVTYTLAGVVNPETGWGIAGDTFTALEILRRYGREGWFQLGDRDLGTHIHRTGMLAKGYTLTNAADSIRSAWGVTSRILPMTDTHVPTQIETDQGTMHFQRYLVQRRAEPVVRGIRFKDIELSAPAPGVLGAIANADAILICPSNPLISIGPILAVPGIRDALRGRRSRVFAVCPIVGGRSLKGPTDRMMAQLGYDVSPLGVAKLYSDVAGTLVIDTQDAAQSSEIEALNMKVVDTATTMVTAEDKERLARFMLEQW